MARLLLHGRARAGVLQGVRKHGSTGWARRRRRARSGNCRARAHPEGLEDAQLAHVANAAGDDIHARRGRAVGRVRRAQLRDQLRGVQAWRVSACCQPALLFAVCCAGRTCQEVSTTHAAHFCERSLCLQCGFTLCPAGHVQCRSCPRARKDTDVTATRQDAKQ